ncbi:MAG: thermonuclease family protein [Chitinispirillaceae bacterium]|nr:thermonuclease family protein [Chitinispirillaceae bacterium]
MPWKKRQAFGSRAKQFTSDLMFNRQVSVKVTDIDRYGRTVGEVILPDGGSLNKELVRAGFAFPSPADTPSPRVERGRENERPTGVRRVLHVAHSINLYLF